MRSLAHHAPYRGTPAAVFPRHRIAQPARLAFGAASNAGDRRITSSRSVKTASFGANMLQGLKSALVSVFFACVCGWGIAVCAAPAALRFSSLKSKRNSRSSDARRTLHTLHTPTRQSGGGSRARGAPTAAPPTTQQQRFSDNAPSWDALAELVRSQELELGANFTSPDLETGPPNPLSLRRTFGSTSPVRVKLYRDHAAWCPYCQKVGLLSSLARVGHDVSNALVRARSAYTHPHTSSKSPPSPTTHKTQQQQGVAAAGGEAHPLRAREDQHALLRRQAGVVHGQGGL